MGKREWEKQGAKPTSPTLFPKWMATLLTIFYKTGLIYAIKNRLTNVSELTLLILLIYNNNGGGMSGMVAVLLLGQVVSFAVAIIAFSSSLLANLGVYMPLTLSLFSYLSVALIYGGTFLSRRQKLMVPWYWYLLMGFFDVQGNYIVNTAYQYTSITSVTMLDSLTIVWAMILTWIFLGTRYSVWQFLGVAVCLMGLGLVTCSDAGIGGGGGRRPLFGDALVIIGTLCFAMSNVGEEYCVKNKDRVELMAMSSAFSLVITICQIYLVERKSVESVTWSMEIILCLIGYTIASFTLISVIPFVLKMSGSTMYSLSILTSDMWAVVIRIFFYQQRVGALYYLSFAIVVIGLIIYSKTVKDPVSKGSHRDEEFNEQYRLLDEDSTAASLSEALA